MNKILDKSTTQLDLGFASVAAVNQYLQLAKSQEIDFDGLLAKLKIPATLLSDNSKQLAGIKFQQLISGLIELSSDDLFGFHTAQFVQPATYSVLGYISINCETLGEAISKIPSFEKLVGDMGITSFSSNQEHFKISWQCLFTEPLVRRHMIDNCLASWLNFAHYLADKQTPPVKVCFTRKRPSIKQQREYETLFNCSVLFKQKSDSIYFRKSLLDYPLKRANKELLNTLESHANKQLEERCKDKNIIEKTKEIILKGLKSSEFRQQHVAKKLGMTTKTLQRKLKIESSSFQVMLDQTRLDHAIGLLGSYGLKLSDISEQLGFQEPRSFYRWFSKQTGETPGKFRSTSFSEK